MRSVSMIFPIEPIGKGRCRVARNGHLYTPKDTAEFMEYIKKKAKIIMAGEKPFPATEAQRAEILYVHKAPKSWSKKRKDILRKRYVPKITKPDIDNEDKIILDALKGVVLEDDKSVHKHTSEKVWGLNNMIKVRIFSFDPWEDFEEAVG